MCTNDSQELFLLEFLVDKLNIPSVQAMHEDVLNVKTCIEFKVLNLPPVYICQDSSAKNCTCLGEDAQMFRKGKSCLFALSSNLLEKPICQFPVTMSVYKKLPPTVLPDVMSIGKCHIELHEMLNCLLQEETTNPCKTLKNNFRISTATGQCVGEITIFLRFSRLGRKVVTQFQNPHNNKPYLFKGADNSPVFQCRKMPAQQPQPECICEKKEPPTECKEEKPPASCCTAKTSRKHRSSVKDRSSKKGSKGPRPCCQSSNREQSGNCSSNKSQTQSLGLNSCGSQPDGAKEKTRQCGCEIKEEKSYSCR